VHKTHSHCTKSQEQYSEKSSCLKQTLPRIVSGKVLLRSFRSLLADHVTATLFFTSLSPRIFNNPRDFPNQQLMFHLIISLDIHLHDKQAFGLD